MDFYYILRSPPCRVVLMTAKAVDVELNLKEIDLLAKDHLKPEFIKINPQHSVPTLVDNGLTLWESRAIIIYLAKKYAKNDSLYPDCPKKQALINQRLFFDTTMFTQCKEYYGPQIFAKAPANPKQFQKMEEMISLFEKFLEGQQYAAGESLTIADIALVVTVSMYELCKVDISKYPNVEKWYKLCKEVVPGIEINEKAFEEGRKSSFKDI